MNIIQYAGLEFDVSNAHHEFCCLYKSSTCAAKRPQVAALNAVFVLGDRIQLHDTVGDHALRGH